MRRGLTLLELLASLTLLSAVMVAVASWTRVSASLATSASRTARERASMETVFRLIAEDLATGDFELVDQRGHDQRVETTSGALFIRTRGAGAADEPGPVVHTYARDAVTDELRLETSRAGRTSTRVLLGGVASFACTLEVEGPDEATTLTVAITGEGGTAFERRYRVE